MTVVKADDIERHEIGGPLFYLPLAYSCTATTHTGLICFTHSLRHTLTVLLAGTGLYV